MKFADWNKKYFVIKIVEEYTLNEEQYEIPKLKRDKYKKINPKTNRIKTFHKQKFVKTDIEPKDRTFKNLPRYANDKAKVRFQDWLLIKPEKISPEHSVPSIGKSEALNAWVGWSHRAVYAFKPGDRVEGDSMGKEVKYKKLPNGETDWDNGEYEPDFTIKDDAHARQVAITFARNVS